MNLFNRKNARLFKVASIVVSFTTTKTVIAQQHPAVTDLITHLQTYNQPFATRSVTSEVSDVYVPNQLMLKFRQGTAPGRKQQFLRTLERDYTALFGTPITIRVVKACPCETIELWELMSSSTSRALGNGGVITTTAERRGSTSMGGDLEGVSLNYYQKVDMSTTEEGANRYRPNLAALISGIRTNRPNDGRAEIIDTGVDPTHPDTGFKNAIWNDATEGTTMTQDRNNNCYQGDRIGYNFVDDNNLPLDYHSHGTHVAGTVYKNSGCVPVKLLIAKALDDHGTGRDMDITCAIYYGIKQKVSTINMSLGRVGTANPIVSRAVAEAIRKDIIVVASAGNYHSDNDVTPVWPANFPNVISVNAHQKANPMMLWQNQAPSILGSNTGARTVHIATLGEQVYSTVPNRNDPYALKSGTSMAAPTVTAATIVTKRRSGLKGMALRKFILSSAMPHNGGLQNLYGILDPNQYCNQAFPNETPSVPIGLFKSNETNAIEEPVLEVNPNPVTQATMITIDYEGTATTANYYLTDIAGNVLIQKEIPITAKITQEALIINDLPSGIYLIKIQIGAIFLNKKVIKM